MKSNAASGPVYVPSQTARVASAKTSQELPATAKPTPGPEAIVPSSDSAPGSSDVHEEGMYLSLMTWLTPILAFRLSACYLRTHCPSSLRYLFHLF